MITIDQLNAILGRPARLGEWKWTAIDSGPIRPCVAEEPSLLKDPPHLILCKDGRVAVYTQGLAASHALELSTYARRVEIEIERMKEVTP